METVPRRRVAIVDGERRFDLVIPVHASVADALDAAGVSPRTGHEVVMESAGKEISPDRRIGELPDGVILVYVDLADASGSAGRRRRLSARHEDRPAAAWWVLGGVGVVLSGVTLFATAGLDAGVRTAVGAIAIAAAAIAAVVFAARTPGRRRSHLGAVIGILLLAFAGGASLMPDVPAAESVLSVFAGMLCAAAFAGAIAVVGRSDTLRAESRTASTLLLVLAGIWGTALLLHLDASSPAAVTLGLLPIAQRMLLSSAVDVSPGVFLDYERFQSTRWTVRQKLPDEVLSIGADDAQALVARSTARLTVGALVLVIAGVTCAPVAIPTFDVADPLVLAGRIALTVTVVLALVLGARKTSVPAVRWVSRLGAAAVLTAALVAFILAVGGGALALLAAACLVIGTASAFLVIPAGRGVRSLGWSRLADAFEALAISLSLPAALLAAGVVDVVRGMMAA